ncbi:FAD/FMN_dependent oxidoreductase [Hexamita inflata]|uniref:FAD/FMN dependent oxidoreductase n=1 Tax=Hexamita inflata TaxID=28002 RepID=A0AA86PZ29_9EUKA|nr:FAD/FMN dependent oxidoreductase [Hexamita inflata]
MFTPVKIANFVCENRSARSPTATGTCSQETGVPEQAFYDFYEKQAAGHPGLMVQEHSFVSWRGHAGHKQLGLHSDEMIQYHKRANDLMRSVNPNIRICCQLAHVGANCDKPDKLVIDTATQEDFDTIVKEFTAAASRALQAGYDCVQIHSGHTYLLSRSISSYYNHRTDSYSHSTFKLLRQVLEGVRTVNIPVGVKLQCDDFINGHTMNARSAVQLLKDLRFDFVEVTGGGNENAEYGTLRQGSGKYYYKHVIQLFKEERILQMMPVIVSGGFQSVSDAEEALSDGVAMVGFSRKFLRDPMFLVQEKDNKKCVRCNMCIKDLVECREVKCAMHKRDIE